MRRRPQQLLQQIDCQGFGKPFLFFDEVPKRSLNLKFVRQFLYFQIHFQVNRQ